MMEAIRLLKERGARRILAGCTHGVFSGDAIARIEASHVEMFLKTNSVPMPPNVETKKIEPLIGILPLKFL